MLEMNLQLNWNYHGKKGKEILFHEAVGSLMTGMRDWSPGFRAMVEEVLEPAVDSQFQSQGGINPWQALAESTAKSKGSPFILVGDGRLWNSFRRGHPDHVEEITRSSLSWGTRVPYALFHQTGTGKGFQQTSVQTGAGTGRGMPMRKILEFTSPMKRELRSIMVQRLATIARREGFAVTGNSALDPLTARRLGQKLLGLE